MTGLVDAVKAETPSGCIATRCRAQGCSVNMTGAPQPNVLVDMDCDDLKIEEGDRRCDFVFVSDDGDWVVALELKRGKPDANEIVEQLQAGARFAESIVPQRAKVRFLPVAVYGGKLHRTEVNRFRRSRIRFRGESVSLELLRCGGRLNQVLK